MDLTGFGRGAKGLGMRPASLRSLVKGKGSFLEAAVGVVPDLMPGFAMLCP